MKNLARLFASGFVAVASCAVQAAPKSDCSGVEAEWAALRNVIARLGPGWVARNRSVTESRERDLRNRARACGVAMEPNVPVGPSWRSLVHDAARRYGLDAGLLESLVRAESGGDPRAVSPKGAMGLTQLMPATARELGVTNPFDPAQNIDGGARYLRAMLDRFGDLRRALAAYNFGPERVERGERWPRETRNYVKTVLRLGARAAASTAEREVVR
jgi:soluble lytic murein transglycosylase-like protein